MTSTETHVDRLLFLLFGLRYKLVVTPRRVGVVIILFWIVGFFDWIDLGSGKSDIAINVISFFLALLSQAHVQNQVSEGQTNERTIPLNIERSKKTATSILLVQLTLVACYLFRGALWQCHRSVNEIENNVT